MKTLRVRFIGKDFWGNLTYQNIDNPNRIYKKVDGKFHTTTEEGEPDCPLRNNIEVEA